MPRATNSVSSHARRKRIIKQAKGYWGSRKNVWSVAKNAVEKALSYAYEGRKQRKRQMRRLWIQRINAGAHAHGLNYSSLIYRLGKRNISMNRKVLADLAMHDPKAFDTLISSLSKK